MKSFWKSKTFWLNIVARILSALQEGGVDTGVPPAAGVLAAVNLGLRSVTKTAVKIR